MSKKVSIVSQMRTALAGREFTGQEASDLYISLGGSPSKFILERTGGKSRQIKDMYSLCCQLPADLVRNDSVHGSAFSLKNTYRLRVMPEDPVEQSKRTWERFSAEKESDNG